MTAAGLLPRVDAALPAAFARSAAVRAEGAGMRTADFSRWMEGRRLAHAFHVERIPFRELAGWSFQEGTGNIVHESGRFFTVEGLSVQVGSGPFRAWQQPIIKQPEVGILGLLAKEFDGVLHFLMQAKMEPGNPNLLQLSPTVQATRSNYTKVHRGAAVKYLEYFTEPGRGRVLTDVLQSEHGSWFHHKANRNVIVQTDGEVEPDPDFCWLTLGQLGELLCRDNVVNMDARTVLACAPLGRAEDRARTTDTGVRSWFTTERARHELRATRIALDGLEGWVRDDDAVRRPDGRYFEVVAVRVEAGNREVSQWTQPLFAPVGEGVVAFLYRRFDGVPHLLVHARVEGGFLDTVELGPTVQCDPANWSHLPPADRPAFLDEVLGAGPERIRYRALHSEEGGRFRDAVSRYLVVETGLTRTPPGYQWVTPGQLSSMAQHGHYVNVQARTLLSVLNTCPDLL
ncbi:NDP-hexose 2,3-dehydratase family protein [Streptomyces sp. HB2AG]|uniref:NDP-hexose 2,3-dehydratase family protein n=1 Tax=Streptomyces sp. HB2AG TaxID=2983400 RepID=UPI0022AAC382|nr:NDP-hexose 2,3-dehydratase family protein [Streptomyces sp. HB2AG]MCZ2526329.1 NDP-hexose 2,3-dehydratase family protein [Streptomyces sp. HB2AG]